MTKILTFLPVLLLLSACAVQTVEDRSREYSRLGNHTLALDVLDQERQRLAAAGVTPDAEFEALYRQAKLAFLLGRGRQYIFQEREDDALVDLAAVLEMQPGHAEALRLRERAFYKKAVRATELGDELLIKNELEAALASYLVALQAVKDWPLALEGADKVRKAYDRLNARAQQQFLEAVRKLPEFRYVEVRWHAGNASTNDPKREDATELRARAQREMAMKAFERGRECQAKDRFGAALVEYRTAQKLDISVPGVEAAIVQMEREVQATMLAEKAQMDMRMGRFEKAREQLGKAFEMSVMSRASISELMIEARKLEGQANYNTARDCEILGQKREALAAFEALSKNWPEGLSDEKVRIEALRSDIESAEKEWAAAEAAEAAGDLPKALEHYQTAVRYYAAMQDGKARIARLRERIAAAGGAGATGG